MDKQHLFNNFILDIKKFLSWEFQDKFKSFFRENGKSSALSVCVFWSNWKLVRTSLESIDNAQYKFDQIPDTSFDLIIDILSQIDIFFKYVTNETSNSDIFVNAATLNGSLTYFIEIMQESKTSSDFYY